ncbi:hypothetical protein GCM10011487_14640 [Steroidobacter agaridevorans]|uniref:DUF2799 domain-containing protein n=2 Tax=Steroidobacter agaridevorans TaxID=2695856 RepID=A0A829Y863_9GAMM|nr:hypothetical protein GCM10011487_14640 [Steroidobacter agaridevorans]
MDREECLTVDWRTVGFEDGAQGYSGDRIGQHRKACAKHGVTPDLTAYQEGRAQGLREYCVPANGFRLGSQGGSYAGLCPSDLDQAFADAYHSGRQLYTLESRLSNVSHQLDSRRSDLRAAESDIVTRSAVAISSEGTAEERAQAVLDVKNLGERVGRLKTQIRQLEEERVHCERDLQDYRATLNLP